MFYNKNTWQKGDPITAEKLNNIENGIENASQNGTSGGGSDLPTPGAAGNVLTSTGSAWESAAPSGGSSGYSEYVIELTESDSTYVATHDGDPVTVDDVLDVIGTMPVILLYDGKIHNLVLKSSGFGTVMFSAAWHDNTYGRAEVSTVLGTRAIGGSLSDTWLVTSDGIYGAEDYVVNLVADENDNITSDKSVSDIYAAVILRKNVYANIEFGENVYARAALTLYSQNLVEFGLVMTTADGGGVHADPVAIQGLAGLESDSWSFGKLL